MTSRHKKWILFAVLLCLILWLTVYIQLGRPLIQSQGTPVIITLDRSTTAAQFVQTLKEKQVIRSSFPLLMAIRYMGLSSKLQAGVYQIKPGETALQLLHRLVAGDVLTQNFTIIAGTTQQKITQDLLKAPYLNYHSQDWALIQGKHSNAEGLLLADTYQYRGGSDSTSLLNQAHHHLIHYLNVAWISRDPNLPYKDPYELLIAASIIEKETAVLAERKLISGVVVNRLSKKMPLQMDPTVIYALGSSYKGKLQHQDLYVNSPYNTYRYRGLPPTPISMIGKEALDAAAHPQRSNYLYFVAKGDGTHQFSETYEEQRRAINQYQHKDL